MYRNYNQDLESTFGRLNMELAYDQAAVGIGKGGISLNKPICIAYQPIINLISETVLGYEALARGPNGERPMQLFSGLTIQERRATELNSLAATGLNTPPGLLFVNLSPSVFAYKAGAPARLALAHSPPQKVVVEIIERLPIPRHIDFAVSTWKENGYELAIDDLGKSPISLLLTSLTSPRYIKLDKSIVASLPANTDRAKMFLRLADKLKAEVVAEGIECEKELIAVKKLGIKYGQGYLLGMPKMSTTLLSAVTRGGVR